MARLRLGPGVTVLDVACGLGAQAIPAARTGACVTGIDLAPNLLHLARVAASKEGLAIQFEEADALALPFEGGAFDLVYSMFGVIYSQRPEDALAEMFRVCRSGGEVIVTAWPPDSFMGEANRLIWRTPACSAGVPLPSQWGIPSMIEERFSRHAAAVRSVRYPVTFRFPRPPEQAAREASLWYGPAFQGQLSLSPPDREPWLEQVSALYRKWNVEPGGRVTRIESEYLEARARKT